MARRPRGHTSWDPQCTTRPPTAAPQPWILPKLPAIDRTTHLPPEIPFQTL